jgi:hypothetical protein
MMQRTIKGAALCVALVLLALGSYRANQIWREQGGALRGMRLSGVSSGAVTSTSGHVFLISGTVSHLLRGQPRQLKLKVKNPTAYKIDVRKLTVRVFGIDSTHTKCSLSSLTVHNFTGHLVIARGASVYKKVPIKLNASAPDACQNALFKLKYGGSAVKA